MVEFWQIQIIFCISVSALEAIGFHMQAKQLM